MALNERGRTSTTKQMLVRGQQHDGEGRGNGPSHRGPGRVSVHCTRAPVRPSAAWRELGAGGAGESVRGQGDAVHGAWVAVVGSAGATFPTKASALDARLECGEVEQTVVDRGRLGL